jgi:NAD(P)H-dependent FMN reductase
LDVKIQERAQPENNNSQYKTRKKRPNNSSWFYDIAMQHKEFNVELIDLLQVNLPVFDEPVQPMLKKYKHQHTIDWSALIEPADAFVIVMPEYNHGFTASIKNALDYLNQEWSYKPVAFVSYGGVAGGTRAVEMLKLVVTALKMMPMAEGVHIPFFVKQIDDQGKFNGNPGLDKSANGVIYELYKWAVALKTMRG